MKWIATHRALFGAHAGTWSEVHQAWASLFALEGRTDEEMTEAVLRVSRRAKIPEWPPGHLEALRAELRGIDEEKRAAMARVRAEREAEFPACPECRGAGWICGVPHPDHLDDNGTWPPEVGQPGYTIAVVCDCPRGQGVTVKTRDGMSPLRLTAYTRRLPDWRARIRRALEYKRAEQAAEAASHGHRPMAWMDRLLSRLPHLQALVSESTGEVWE